MLDQFLVGIAAGICNIAIHALLMTLVVRGARAMGHQHVRWPSMRLTAVMMITAVILKVAHTTEIMVWALTYRLVGAVPEGTGLIYFAFVNYTTLGYGDVVPVKDWQLLGPMTAMNGVLLFGWSTAVIFEVLVKALGDRPSATAPAP